MTGGTKQAKTKFVFKILYNSHGQLGVKNNE